MSEEHEEGVTISPEMMHLLELASSAVKGAVDRLTTVVNRLLIAMLAGAFGVGVFFATTTLELRTANKRLEKIEQNVAENTKTIGAGILSRAENWQHRHDELHREERRDLEYGS